MVAHDFLKFVEKDPSKEMGRRDQEASASAAPSLRKGPWMAEEDAVLIEYVRKHGPRDWSSIRHKGLLPRSGKSCRLRWVNKLKPDLKTGCKFSPEEERVVINLQAQFGNKWARIATYLPGRTDNDVKNFWSTRQKRLARLLQAQSKANSQGAHGKSPVFCHELMPFQALLDLPLLPETHHLATDFEGVNFDQAPLAHHGVLPEFDLLTDGLPCLDLRSLGDVKVEEEEVVPAGPDGFFDDFPVDMLDSLNPPASSSRP
ncbi:hypothetical protein Taro_016970 [Colocasia esculenta]|uniref:Uncharacterized protein n=1 Tax=Colocasia esculenta TaxID=4460 RepID=A0A843UMA5_COLES|nr:hypothetical protein [Colocasia esculenta]